MLISRRRHSGVTLVELVVTLSVVAILATLAIPGFQSLLLNREISSSAEAALNGLQLARAEAVRRNTQVKFVLNADSTWTVGCVTVTANCPANIQSSTLGDGSSNRVALTATPSTATTAAFNSFGAIIGSLSDLTQLDFDLPTGTLPASEAHPLRVEIGTGGGARLCDPAYSSPDARAC